MMPSEPRVRRDCTSMVLDVRALLLAEVQAHPRNDDFVERILAGIEELAATISEQREEIVALRLLSEDVVWKFEPPETT